MKRTNRRHARTNPILSAIAGAVLFLIDPDLIPNKLAAVAMILLTLPCIFVENDATATVFIAFLAVPMFFARERWIY